MFYEKHILDQKEMFGENIVIGKETLIRLAMDTSLYGASNIKSAVAVTSLCQAYYKGQSEKHESCAKIVTARENLDKQKSVVETLKKEGKKDLAEIESLKYDHMRSDFLRIYKETCGNCPYSSRIAGVASKRMNYARYFSQQETLSHIKTLLALHLLVPSAPYVQDETSGIQAHTVNIGILANSCQLSRNSVRDSLHYWEEEGYIHFAALNRGNYLVTFSQSESEKRYAPASEGGAGYITVPLSGITSMLKIQNVDILRLLIMVYLNMDSDLYDGSYSAAGNGVRGEGQYVRFVRLHHNASFRDLINRFNKHMLLMTNGGIRLSVTGSGLDRYDHMSIFMKHEFAPKQKTVSESLEEQSLALSRGLSQETIASIESLEKEFLSVNQWRLDPMLQFLFPKLGNKQDWVGDNSDVRPTSLGQTFIPALSTIKHLYGDKYITKALKALFKYKKDELDQLWDRKKSLIASKNKDFENIVTDLSKYILSIAKQERTADFSSYHNFALT